MAPSKPQITGERKVIKMASTRNHLFKSLTEGGMGTLEAIDFINGVEKWENHISQPVKPVERSKKNKKGLKRFLKLLVALLFVAEALFFLWVIASWVDIVLHNLHPNPEYQPWNLIVWAINKWCM